MLRAGAVTADLFVGNTEGEQAVRTVGERRRDLGGGGTGEIGLDEDDVSAARRRPEPRRVEGTDSRNVRNGRVEIDGCGQHLVEGRSNGEDERRLCTARAQDNHDYVVREGIIFDYPASNHIIPDPKCIRLREFVGADWVAQEFILSCDEVKEIYSVDVGDSYTAYSRPDGGKSIDQRVARSSPGAPRRRATRARAASGKSTPAATASFTRSAPGTRTS